MARRSDRWLALLLGVSTLLTIAVVLVPILLIRPFSPETETTIAIAYALRTSSPWLAPAGAAVAAALALVLLRGRPGRLVALAAACAVALAAGAAWLSHQNHFEWMFKPLPDARYARAGAATFPEPSDMVVAVELKGDAVAYPVREMGYHHLVNDVVGGVPVVSTY
jgi:hypothetical protein